MSATSVSIVMPWRPQPSRLDAFNHCTAFWSDLLPGAELVLADSTAEVFNLSEARNIGASQATGDVLLIVDADSLAPAGTVLRAIETAAIDGRMQYCFDGFTYLDEEQSRRVYAGHEPEISYRGPHESSVMAIRRDSYWRAGGSDERFTTWGGEDNALRAACDTILGGSNWHPGTGFTLWHESHRATTNENLELVARYRAAWMNEMLMRPILAEPGRHSREYR